MSIKHFIISLSVALPFICWGCSDDDDPANAEINSPKPGLNVIVSPQSGLCYGDQITVSGTLTDDRNLDMYTIILKNGDEELYRKEQMLLGQSFQMNERITLPMPKDAGVGNFQVEVNLRNTQHGETSQVFELTSLQVPTFDKLYLLLSNKTVIELLPNGDTFECDETFPANIKGIISTTPSNSGLYWGSKDGEIQTMVSDSILIGTDVEASCKVSFNPKTFALTFGQRFSWTTLPSSDCFYILGTISGHWQDGEITEEKAKMRMQGYESGNSRYYTWTPPEGDDVETGMWGSTAAGVFRLKKGGEDRYLLWNGAQLVYTASDEAAQSFPVTAGGAFEIRVYFEDDVCTKVSIAGSDKTLEFTNESVKANGVVMGQSIDFGGSQLQKQSGTSYMYEGEVSLTKGASVTSSSIDLSMCSPNEDLFSGAGNDSWTLQAATGKYYVSLDAFSGSSYIRPANGYPDAIYMAGWSWAHSESGTAQVWQNETALPLVRVGDSHTYEGTCYVFSWGGDIKFFVSSPSDETAIWLPNDNFDDKSSKAGGGGFYLPTAEGYYKVSVDLKDGINVGSDGSITTVDASKQFTLRYTAK